MKELKRAEILAIIKEEGEENALPQLWDFIWGIKSLMPEEQAVFEDSIISEATDQEVSISEVLVSHLSEGELDKVLDLWRP